jgi:ankyrin repeat protein
MKTHDIFKAIEVGNIEALRAAIEAGEDVNTPDEDGNTPLHKAVEKDRFKMVRMLLEAGADPNVRNKRGETPIVIAARAGIPLEPPDTPGRGGLRLVK